MVRRNTRNMTNVTPVNVTPHGFSVFFQTSEPTTPSISVYADAAGTTRLAGQVGVELLPLHTGDRAITEAYARRQNLKSIRIKTLSLGLAQVRVTGFAIRPDGSLDLAYIEQAAEHVGKVLGGKAGYHVHLRGKELFNLNRSSLLTVPFVVMVATIPRLSA
jgi:hypothetical protein